MRGLLWIACVLLAFGLGSYRVLGEFNLFNTLNLIGGAAALAVSAIGIVRRIRRSAAASAGDNVARSFAVLVLTCVGAVAAVWLTSQSSLRFDWTFEKRYEVSPATTAALQRTSDPLRMTLYSLEGDPRIRNTRILLDEIARHGNVKVRQKDLDSAPEDEDRFAIGSSNTVVIERRSEEGSTRDWQRVERPSEGALFEAISYLADPPERRVVYAMVGAGEGDLEKSQPRGFSGLRAALETEGYEVRPLPSSVIDEVPADADVVLAVAPQRALRDTAVQALARYLDQGGTLVAMIDPGTDGGLESLLSRYGISSPNAVLIDPDSGPVDGDPPGLNPIAHSYASHPVTRGLDSNRHTFFRRARAFELVKPERDDKLAAVVYSSASAWLEADLGVLESAATPQRPPTSRADYWPIVVAGRYPRDSAEARIVAFGDSDFASNRYLRALYNVDLVMNAMHWAARREPDITLRPKAAELIQFPVPLQNSIRALYGVGLLVPEILLVLAGVMWMRSRTA